MTEKTLDETEQTFADDFEFLERIKKIKSKKDIDMIELILEYNILAEKYGKLLKNAVRIAKNGDKAQKKLIKYKDLMDTMRNVD
jgi:hypothetical protein